jgi:hypothetical protein
MKSLAIALASVLASVSFAQVSPAAPPVDALVPDQARLLAAVAGHTFQWHSEDSGRSRGVTARLQYRESGVVINEADNGYFDTGTWRVEGSQLCAKWQKRAGGCQEVRIAGDTLWLEYKDGKWASMTLVKDGKSSSVSLIHDAGAHVRVG